MKPKQLYYGLIALLVLAVFGFGGLAYETNKLLSGQATKLAKLRADSEVADSLQASLAKNKQDIAKYQELDTIAETVVPQDKDQAEAVREIVNLAAQSGISKLTSISFPTSTLGATLGGSNSKITQLTPVKGMSGVYNLTITVTQDSSTGTTYNQLISFLSRLEQNRRTAQVSSLTIQPDPQNPNIVAFTLVMNEYIKP